MQENSCTCQISPGYGGASRVLVEELKQEQLSRSQRKMPKNNEVDKTVRWIPTPWCVLSRARVSTTKAAIQGALAWFHFSSSVITTRGWGHSPKQSGVCLEKCGLRSDGQVYFLWGLCEGVNVRETVWVGGKLIWKLGGSCVESLRFVFPLKNEFSSVCSNCWECVVYCSVFLLDINVCWLSICLTVIQFQLCVYKCILYI